MLQSGSFILLWNCVLMVATCGVAASAEVSADCSAYASIALPVEARAVPVPKTPPACASYRSYRGIGRPINYSAARACAWQERLAQIDNLGQNSKEPTAWIVGGSLILADIYFNGAGVKRDTRLAMRFACESDEEMVKLALPDIEKLNGSPPRDGPFEFCRYSATTITMNFCSAYENEKEDADRSRFYDSLKSSMTAAQKAAFDSLLSAERAYVEAHAAEVDQGGTIRGIRTKSSQNILKDLFRTEIIHVERMRRPAVSAEQIKTADSLLNHEYENRLQQLRRHTKEEIDEGAVAATNLARVQKTWEGFRDAWTTFARVRYPAAAAAIRAEIVLDRYRLLKTIS